MLGIIDADPGTWLMHESSRPLFCRGAGGLSDFPGSWSRAWTARRPRRSPPRRPATSPAARRGAAAGSWRAAAAAPTAMPSKLRARLPAHELVEDRRSPVHALTDAGGDLIVVGSRGLHGIRASGASARARRPRRRGSVLVAR